MKTCLVDFNVAVDATAFILLLLEPVGEAIPNALLDLGDLCERPAFLPICLPNVVTRVTTSGTGTPQPTQFLE